MGGLSESESEQGGGRAGEEVERFQRGMRCGMSEHAVRRYGIAEQVG